jgi:hypothetical protein
VAGLAARQWLEMLARQLLLAVTERATPPILTRLTRSPEVVFAVTSGERRFGLENYWPLGFFWRTFDPTGRVM